MTQAERKRAWQRHITDWQASGLSGMAYCKQQSLTYCQFVYWRKKLINPEPVSDEPAMSGFARAAPIPGADSPEGLTVSLPGGVSITGLHAGNVELLSAVLRQL
ncbi:IS66 family insertion sequence element accessory protein TnpA [Marinobacter salexigens]|uniref:IS66 family insertion sequence element accessory protein TnpB n=1 Tax=Marinobacter salexigens TaxID=1925763 RepID=A0ABS6ACT1_9GAMM|nr:IS66 family insertion sequence element accessory protein TnpB [Marinobacter salexigens]MBU2874669.1 IS66 family insertion sequence element accessory protein TnpB [Marinobacter salexigens]